MEQFAIASQNLQKNELRSSSFSHHLPRKAEKLEKYVTCISGVVASETRKCGIQEIVSSSKET